MNNTLNENGTGIHGTIDEHIKKGKSFKMILIVFLHAIQVTETMAIIQNLCVTFTHYGCSYTHFHLHTVCTIADKFDLTK